MKTLPEGMQAHLDSGATTLCHCWKLTRRDGRMLAFTDHDRPLQFDGSLFEPASGFTATAIESSLGLNVDNLNVVGALSSHALTEADLAAGLYDDADIEIWRVNWQDVAQRVILRKGNLGEVSRGGMAFEAEMRGLVHRLNQPTGRVFQHSCDAALGDARCGVDLDDPAFLGSGSVVLARNRRIFTAGGLAAFAGDWFSRGKLTWTSGANAGRSAEVKRHTKIGSEVTIELWQEMSEDVLPSDSFTITAGCDGMFATCKTKFHNAKNFRGFPFMPGNDWITSYPNRGEGNTGGSLHES